MTGLTRRLAQIAADTRYEDIGGDALTAARHCLLDYTGVTLAGADNAIVGHLLSQCKEDGGHPQAVVYGRRDRLSVPQAALVNGTASHVLDYDDVNMAWPGHPSVVLWPAILALSEARGADGKVALAAFVAGYELASRLGEAMAPGHYGAGFHPTATLGSIAAAVASAHVIELGPSAMAHAIAISATQAAGLKSMFGTMCKPLHAGKAAANGVLAAQLAARGFAGRDDFIECEQGFVATHGPDFNPDRALAPRVQGFHTRRTLFKYHATCYLTHSVIDAANALADGGRFDLSSIQEIYVETHHMARSVCHIEQPASGLEAKFSLTLAAAMGLMRCETGCLDLFDDALPHQPELVALRNKVRVDFVAHPSPNWARVTVRQRNGTSVCAEVDTGLPADDLNAQEQRLMAKYLNLANPVIGAKRSQDVADLIAGFEHSSPAELAAITGKEAS